MRGGGTFATELRQTLSLALPIMVAQVGQMLMGLTDTLVVGQLRCHYIHVPAGRIAGG
jgi:Na+-driven multidrug efflux pump